MAKSALASRLDKIEQLLASRLRGPEEVAWLSLKAWDTNSDIDARAAAMRKAADPLVTLRIVRWQTDAEFVAAGGDLHEAAPLALPKPLLRLTFRAPPEEPKPPPKKKPADADGIDERAEKAREKFHGPIKYPRYGIA